MTDRVRDDLVQLLTEARDLSRDDAPEAVGRLIADIDREMEGRERGYADVRGELLFRCRDALAAPPVHAGEAVGRLTKVADEWAEATYIFSRGYKDNFTRPDVTKRQVAKDLRVVLAALSSTPVHAGEAGHCFECETELVGPLCPECNPEIKAALSWSPSSGEDVEELRVRAWRILETIPAINDLSSQFQEDITDALVAALSTRSQS